MKKRTFQAWICFLVFISTFYISCRYEEGPLISFRSKLERISNAWQIDKFDHDGVDITRNFQYVTFNIIDDYTFNLERTDTVFDNLVKQHFRSFVGEWDFDSEKDNIFLQFSSPIDSIDGGRDVWRIKKLMETEVWLEIDLPGKHNKKQMVLKPR